MKLWPRAINPRAITHERNQILKTVQVSAAAWRQLHVNTALIVTIS